MCSNYSAKVLKTMIDGEVMRGCEKFIIGRNLRIKVVSCYGSWDFIKCIYSYLEWR